MINIENVEVQGFEPAIRGMRNPMNSWDKSDSEWQSANFCDAEFIVGDDDLLLAGKLASAGPVHAKYRRMITVWCDITAPLYWWKEFDTYRFGVEKNSCSTMHKVHAKEFTLDDFSHEHFDTLSHYVLVETIKALNHNRNMYLETKDKDYWWQIIQLLPSSYNQKRTVMVSYESLSNMYYFRNTHKLDEWREFCRWIRTLPYAADIIYSTEVSTHE